MLKDHCALETDLPDDATIRADLGAGALTAHDRRVSVACPSVRPWLSTSRSTIDCSAPHELADWWAEALGWQVEPQDESFIRRMVETGAASEEDTTRHRGALVWKIGAAINSPDPGRPRVLFQPCRSRRRSRTGCTSTSASGADRREAEVARLLALGATELWRASQGPFEWATLADPEGNEFCVT